MNTNIVEEQTADVIVIGGGPAGAATAFWLAMRGVSVIVLEKKQFPRDKTCGDGLTPRAVVELEAMGLQQMLDTQHKYNGLRAVAFGRSYELPWPSLSNYPNYGYVVRRSVLDQAVLERAAAVGATVLYHHEAVEATLASGQIQSLNVRNTATEETLRMTARIYVLAEGSNARIARSLGAHRNVAKPLGLAIRGYFETDRSRENWIESHLDLRDESGATIPGYGWIFPVGDGTANVGFGLLSNSARWRKTNTTNALARFVSQTQGAWHFPENRGVREATGGKLQMGLSVEPRSGPNFLMVGDAVASINPFNGEGISYGYETGRMAANAITQSLGTGDLQPVAGFTTALEKRYAGYYTAGTLFVMAISNPLLMSSGVWLAMRSKATMTPVVAIMANLMSGSTPERIEQIYRLTQRLQERQTG
ncbi:geranylgeranyl reductase family protein [Ferrimicrobium sp.]|uniref:geranylgeranyl reductase family protein n=1 Tax=Ferrimicrobium sp. TaxID=2926050 RepID=UPI0026171E2D|nr:geranylgeranyl reductase family protein [Ferrimicrobium sp.]